jgi:hypothetical protein
MTNIVNIIKPIAIPLGSAVPTTKLPNDLIILPLNVAPFDRIKRVELTLTASLNNVDTSKIDGNIEKSMAFFK